MFYDIYIYIDGSLLVTFTYMANLYTNSDDFVGRYFWKLTAIYVRLAVFITFSLLLLRRVRSF